MCRSHTRNCPLLQGEAMGYGESGKLFKPYCLQASRALSVALLTGCHPAAGHHSACASFMTDCLGSFGKSSWSGTRRSRTLTSHELCVHSFHSRHNRVRHRAGCKEICWDGCVTRITAFASPSYHIPIIWSHNDLHARYHTCCHPSRRYLY